VEDRQKVDPSTSVVVPPPVDDTGGAAPDAHDPVI
jgi:hypothetical protein